MSDLYGHPSSLEIDLTRTMAVLHVSPSFIIHCAHPPPHWWFRFWQRLLLGWRWERV